VLVELRRLKQEIDIKQKAEDELKVLNSKNEERIQK
jgi:hypothetical protein